MRDNAALVDEARMVRGRVAFGKADNGDNTGQAQPPQSTKEAS
jgi:hypothetical protein